MTDRILLVSEYFPPAIGGSSELLANIYTRLHGDVRVLTTAHSGVAEPPVNGADVVRMRFPAGLGLLAPTAREAGPAVAFIVVLQVAVAVASRIESWTTWVIPWWMWLLPVVPEGAIFVTNTWSRPHRALLERGIRRQVGIGLLAVASACNAILVFAVIASLVSGHESSGAHLLLKGATVWLTNVILFGLWFWLFDRGGPVRRLRANAPPPDFQFPQTDEPDLVPGWRPHFVDYMYVSFTNSIAFSPTDTMPLSRWSKLLMLLESALSALVILLVAARAVNIFKS